MGRLLGSMIASEGAVEEVIEETEEGVVMVDGLLDSIVMSEGVAMNVEEMV